MPSILDRVHTVVTPGHSIDVLVTDHGIAVNPRRQDLYQKFKKANLPVMSIEALKEKANQIVGMPEPIKVEDRIVGVVKYRDGSVIDVIRQVKKESWR
jgi:citrate lyase subunit alpha/citrate CoA-transferase